MLELKPRQRAMLVEKVPDLANLAAGTLFFGQFLADGDYSVAVGFGGILVWLAFMGLAFVLAGGAKQTEEG